MTEHKTILDWIDHLWDENGYSPTHRQIADKMGRSIGHINMMIRSLEAQGHIYRKGSSLHIIRETVFSRWLAERPESDIKIIAEVTGISMERIEAMSKGLQPPTYNILHLLFRDTLL